MQFAAQQFRQRISEKLTKDRAPSMPPAAAAPAPISVSRTVDLSALAAVQEPEAFLQEAYRLILRREGDVYGFVHFREMLHDGAPRELILRAITGSDEAKRLGLEYTGVGNFSGLVGTFGYRVRSRARTARFALLARLRGLAALLLQVRRFERIEHKIDLLEQQFGARADRISAKSDEGVWVISEKLDAYGLELKQQHAVLRDALAKNQRLLGEVSRIGRVSEEVQQLCREIQRQSGDVQRQSDDVQRLAAAIAQIEAVLRADFERLSRKQDANTLHLAAVQKEAEARIARVESSIRPPVLRGGDDVLVTEVDGFIVGVPAKEWRMAAFHTFRGNMEPGLTRRLQAEVKPGMVAVDVGANVGMFTLHLARLVGPEGKVYSFEPTPSTFAILRDNVQVNGLLETGIVDLRQVAVTDRAGSAQLTTYASDSGHNTLFAETDRAGEPIAVATTTLDEALAEGPVVDVVKIDAEGAEPLILRGMRGVIERNPGIAIAIEFAPPHLTRAGVDPAAFLDELAAWGFAIECIDGASGELEPASKQELMRVLSVNLWLRRAEASA